MPASSAKRDRVIIGFNFVLTGWFKQTTSCKVTAKKSLNALDTESKVALVSVREKTVRMYKSVQLYELCHGKRTADQNTAMSLYIRLCRIDFVAFIVLVSIQCVAWYKIFSNY